MTIFIKDIRKYIRTNMQTIHDFLCLLKFNLKFLFRLNSTAQMIIKFTNTSRVMYGGWITFRLRRQVSLALIVSIWWGHNLKATVIFTKSLSEITRVCLCCCPCITLAVCFCVAGGGGACFQSLVKLYCAVQRQTAVAAYLKSKQLLLFVFAGRHCSVAWWSRQLHCRCPGAPYPPPAVWNISPDSGSQCETSHNILLVAKPWKNTLPHTLAWFAKQHGRKHSQAMFWC